MVITVLLALGVQIGEPVWSRSELKPGKAEFRAIRANIQRKYGLIPEGALLEDDRDAKAALNQYKKTHAPADAFRAVYLALTTRDGVRSRQFRIGVDPFKHLPSDDYEVARLRFLWSWPYLEYKLKPLADRLLKVDPRDAEVLRADSYTRSHFGRGEEKLGVERAELAMKLAPCVRTYVRAADARAMLYLRTKDKADADKAIEHFALYFNSARRDDPARDVSVKCVAWLRTQGF